MSSEDRTVCCYNCGYLALRISESRELVCAEGDYRRIAKLPDGIDSAKYDAYPYCFKGEVDFKSEMGSPDAVRAVRSINLPRGCRHWRKWHPGRSPKEHEEMSLVEMIRAETAEARAEDRLILQRHYTRNYWYWISSFIVSAIAVLASVFSTTLTLMRMPAAPPAASQQGQNQTSPDDNGQQPELR